MKVDALRSVTLRNRTVMGSMHTGLEEAPRGFERLAAFYAALLAGFGLVMAYSNSASAGNDAFAGGSAYNASKFALEGLTQVLAHEMASFTHVRVNALNPAMVSQ